VPTCGVGGALQSFPFFFWGGGVDVCVLWLSFAQQKFGLPMQSGFFHPVQNLITFLCTGSRWDRFISLKQGCQMVYFQTKTPNLGKLWRALEWKMLVYLWSFGNLVKLWYFSPVGVNFIKKNLARAIYTEKLKIKLMKIKCSTPFLINNTDWIVCVWWSACPQVEQKIVGSSPCQSYLPLFLFNKILRSIENV
jgi:hypothetical protein